ncbi:hypothetical protein ALMP_25720 [Streptomyces sp. A012304]|nr:hypothetical protein ALMP_25720 [Streptomyces sp. A012304]
MSEEAGSEEPQAVNASEAVRARAAATAGRERRGVRVIVIDRIRSSEYVDSRERKGSDADGVRAVPATKDREVMGGLRQ